MRSFINKRHFFLVQDSRREVSISLSEKAVESGLATQLHYESAISALLKEKR